MGASRLRYMVSGEGQMLWMESQPVAGDPYEADTTGITLWSIRT